MVESPPQELHRKTFNSIGRLTCPYIHILHFLKYKWLIYLHLHGLWKYLSTKEIPKEILWQFSMFNISQGIVSENFLADCYSCQKLLTAQARLLSGPKPPQIVVKSLLWSSSRKSELVSNKKYVQCVVKGENSWKVEVSWNCGVCSMTESGFGWGPRRSLRRFESENGKTEFDGTTIQRPQVEWKLISKFLPQL